MTQERQDGWLEQLIELEKKRSAVPWTLQTIDKGSSWRRYTVVSPAGIVANIDEGRVLDMGANAHFIEAFGNAAPALLDVAQKAQELMREGAIEEGFYVTHAEKCMALRGALEKLKAGS